MAVENIGRKKVGEEKSFLIFLYILYMNLEGVLNFLKSYVEILAFVSKYQYNKMYK